MRRLVLIYFCIFLPVQNLFAGANCRDFLLRVALVQYEMGRPKDLAEWKQKVTKYVEEAIGSGAKLVLFPELISLEGLTLVDPNGTNSAQAMREVARQYTPTFNKLFSELSAKHNLTIVSGTWPKMDESGNVHNVAFVYEKNGLPLIEQRKNHLTYDEDKLYFLKGGTGNALPFKVENNIDTRVAICFDCEFPNYLPFDKGTIPELVLIPSMTSDAFGRHRVRRAATARAVEYHGYVLVTGTVGGNSEDPVLGAHSAQAIAFAPSDKRFPADGVLAVGPLDKSHVLTLDLDFDILRTSRKESTTFPVKKLHEK